MKMPPPGSAGSAKVDQAERLHRLAVAAADLVQPGMTVEIVTFGWPRTGERRASLGLAPELRLVGDGSSLPFRTDNGGYVLDCKTGPIADPERLAASVKAITGVVDHGLFVDMAAAAMQVDLAGDLVYRER